jgi:ABC-type Fe3+ transport system permease subunit
MAEIDTTLKQPPPDKNKRERIATVCSLCGWVVILAFCWAYSTVQYFPDDIWLEIAYVVTLLVAGFFIGISVVKIWRAVLNLYKHRGGDSSPSDLPET